ncbi:MAG: DUF3046 domain-containing protein [Actinobacteria bacterium]|nr:DUF3046 domain-containing protein [Actinomycetota bacterium]
MKLSQFHNLLNDEFGEGMAAVLLRDVRLTEFADLTPLQLLEAGEDPRLVWFAICKDQGIPKDRWLGKNKPKRHAD